MKKIFASLFLPVLLLAGCMGDRTWHKEISGNHISIDKGSEYLNIVVFVPSSNLPRFDNADAYESLLVEALADYLQISDRGRFQCPGLETVSETEENDGTTTRFRMPVTALRNLNDEK